MSYTDIIIESPLPVTRYESTISVKGDGDVAELSWSGTFDADGASDEEAESVIGGIYEAGLQGISEIAAE